MSLQCSACEQYFPETSYSFNQRVNKGNARRCKQCIQDGNFSDKSSVSSHNSYHSNRSGYYNNNYNGGNYYNKYNNLAINENDEEYYPSYPASIDSDKSVKICRYWDGSPGSCRFGARCHFRHVQKSSYQQNSYQNDQLQEQKEAAERVKIKTIL